MLFLLPVHLGKEGSRKDLCPSIADVLFDGLPIADAIRDTSIPGYHIVTGSIALANFDITVANRDRRTEVLRDWIKSINTTFDIILPDCPPTMSMLPVNAIVACDQYPVSVLPHYLALEGPQI